MQLFVVAHKIESQNKIETLGHPVLYTGMGLKKASACLEHYLQENHPTRIINFGTAGSVLFPTGVLTECTKFIHRGDLSLPAIETTALSPLEKVICGSADHLEVLKGTEPYQIVDMEAYSLALVCQKNNIPFTSIKYITDSSKEDVQDEWKRNVALAAPRFIDEYRKFENALFHN